MHTGMLWFDNSQSKLTVKIQRAAAYYEKKYGIKPDLCLVHPSMIDGTEANAPITTRPYRPVLPGHIWVGMAERQG